jgi:hypothetical protein
MEYHMVYIYGIYEVYPGIFLDIPKPDFSPAAGQPGCCWTHSTVTSAKWGEHIFSKNAEYAQGSTARALYSQAPRALRCAALRTVQRRAAKARAVPRLAGKARGAARKRNDRGGNDRRRMEIVAKTKDEPMLRAWARSSSELRR